MTLLRLFEEMRGFRPFDVKRRLDLLSSLLLEHKGNVR